MSEEKKVPQPSPQSQPEPRPQPTYIPSPEPERFEKGQVPKYDNPPQPPPREKR
ncbi:hypothetical protein FHW36_101606 [Chitinophaga polysaccharea]|uniref:Uncharacterized protein n=1 Tax=Chitinophaga polysaccharea TaxID=1293035 RepID=A0A561Q2U1_9BACT|nr:hypothetical protein FHW36_101606 [Chitinophaga polysaccharea]